MTTCLSGGCRRSSTLVTQSGGLSYDTLSASPVIYGAQRIWDWCLAMVASNFYILYSQQLCWRFVCEGQSCLSQCEEIFSRGHKIILKLRISFYLSCSFCDILGVKNILFSPVSLPPPPPFFFLLHVCLFVCVFIGSCMHASVGTSQLYFHLFPLWIAGAFEVYSIFVVADLPKYQRAQKLLFISLKWRPLRF